MKLEHLAVLANIAEMTSEMNLNNNNRRLKQAEQDNANKRWEDEFAQEKLRDQRAYDAKMAEVRQDNLEMVHEHGRENVEYNQTTEMWEPKIDGYDIKHTSVNKEAELEAYNNSLAEFKKVAPFIELGDTQSDNEAIMRHYYAGAKAGSDLGENYILDPTKYVDPATKMYIGVDWFSQEYLGDDDITQANDYILGLFGQDSWNEEERAQMESLGLMDADGNDWFFLDDNEKNLIKSKWEGYKSGVKNNTSYYNKKMAREEQRKMEDHIIKHQSAFLDSDQGKIVYDEYTKQLQAIQLSANEDGTKVDFDIEFTHSKGKKAKKGKTKTINISKDHKLKGHLQDLSPDNWQPAYNFYLAMANGQIDSSFVELYIKDLNSSGNLMGGTHLASLQESMIDAGRSQDFQQFYSLLRKRATINKGISKYSNVLSNQEFASGMMKDRADMITLLGHSTVSVLGTEVGLREYILNPNYTDDEKGNEILKARDKWHQLGRDLNHFDTYMDMFFQYSDALNTVQTQFTP